MQGFFSQDFKNNPQKDSGLPIAIVPLENTDEQLTLLKSPKPWTKHQNNAQICQKSEK
jgi:hypothetical protein